MRRSDKEISDRSEIERIILSAKVCRLGLSDGKKPYIVPLCFGYKENTIYFHSASEGKKIDLIEMNPHVCFEFDGHIEIIESDDPCGWGMKYQSIIGFGKASLLKDIQSKRKAMEIIMRQYSRGTFLFKDSSLEVISVIKVDIETMTGKRSGM